MIILKNGNMIYEIEDKNLSKKVLLYIEKQLCEQGRIDINLINKYKIIVQYI